MYRKRRQSASDGDRKNSGGRGGSCPSKSEKWGYCTAKSDSIGVNRHFYQDLYCTRVIVTGAQQFHDARLLTPAAAVFSTIKGCVATARFCGCTPSRNGSSFIGPSKNGAYGIDFNLFVRFSDTKIPSDHVETRNYGRVTAVPWSYTGLFRYRGWQDCSYEQSVSIAQVAFSIFFFVVAKRPDAILFSFPLSSHSPVPVRPSAPNPKVQSQISICAFGTKMPI